MDYYQIIANNFQATIESIALSVDDLVDPLTRASERSGRGAGTTVRQQPAGPF
jgi:hypothetical protein